jgi:hypothetical protein
MFSCNVNGNFQKLVFDRPKSTKIDFGLSLRAFVFSSDSASYSSDSALFLTVYRLVVKMGKNFQVVSAFCVILVHVNNAEVGNLSLKSFHSRLRRR